MVASLDRRTEEGGTEAPDLPAELARDWDGVCGIAVEIGPDLPAALAADPACATLAIDVIAEAISNAVRHGGATSAWVRLRLVAPGRVLVHVCDNGSGIAPTAGRGQGTARLDECEISWQRADEGGGVSLRCVLAPASGAPPALGRPGLGDAPGPTIRSVRGPTPEAAAADLR